MTLKGIHGIVLLERSVVAPNSTRALQVAIGGAVISDGVTLPPAFAVEVAPA